MPSFRDRFAATLCLLLVFGIGCEDDITPPAAGPPVPNFGPTGDSEVWILDLVRGIRSRLTPSAPYTFTSPVWSPTGDLILYVSAKIGTWDLYMREADGSGEEVPFMQTEFDKSLLDWHGHCVLYWRDDPNYAGSVVGIRDIPTDESTMIFELRGGIPHARFSPDGRYLVYDTIEAGRSEVVIHHIDGGARWQVSTNGGRLAHWSDDGGEIVFLDPQRKVMAVSVRIDAAGLTLGQPEELFQIVQNAITWDVTGDHSRFLLATRPELASEPLHVILNWDMER